MTNIEASSYRDPSAFVFSADGIYYRHIQPSYREDYEHLMSSTLYKELTDKQWLITHEESDLLSPGAYKVLKPRQLPLVNYPYEWGFAQLKAAALLTLQIQKTSMTYGMTLKDATAFNICFDGSEPVFIDSSSFTRYDESKPWQAYSQFCRHFLAPLLMARYRGSAMLGLISQFPDGIPLEVAAKLLPRSASFKLLSALHILLPVRMASKPSHQKTFKPFNHTRQLRIIDHLISGIKDLDISRETSQWSRYYAETILSSAYLQEKTTAVDEITHGLHIHSVADLGANTGAFAKHYAAKGIRVIAVDSDRLCVDQLYGLHKNITALYIDLMNPTPALGWMNEERRSFFARIQTELTLALALVHHLAIAQNLPFHRIAEGFARFSPYLLIEFVPKHDPRVQQLLQHREDIFPHYSEASFRQEFQALFDLLREQGVPGSDRKLFLFKRK